MWHVPDEKTGSRRRGRATGGSARAASHLMWGAGAAAMLLCGLLAPALTEAQAGQTPASSEASGTATADGYAVGGVVVDAATGRPLEEAEVVLGRSGYEQQAEGLADGSNGQVAAMEAGRDGSFRFSGLRAGDYTLTVDRRGYVQMALDEHGGFSTGVVVGPNVRKSDMDPEHIVFRLKPMAVLTGTVTDDAGEPVEGATVHLFRDDDANGTHMTRELRSTMTDDLGRYEFSRIGAGTYFLAVIAKPWYAVHLPARRAAAPAGADDGGAVSGAGSITQGPALQPEVDSALDVAFPTTFYANTTDEAEATPIPVRGGEHVPVDFQLHAVPAIHVMVQTPPSPSPALAGEGFSQVMLMQKLFGENMGPASVMLSQYGENGLVELSGVAPGTYEVQIRQMGRHSGMQGPIMDPGTTTRVLNLTGDQGQVDLSGAASPGAVTGELIIPDRGPDHGVNLLFAGPRGTRQVFVRHDGYFSLDALEPGTYEISANDGDPLVLVSGEAQGARLRGSTLEVTGSSPVTLKLTMRHSGAGEVRGFVRQGAGGDAAGETGRSGVMVVLAPENMKETEKFRRDQSNTDGSFRLAKVVPGRYTLLAIEDGWKLEWAKPAVLEPYLAKGIRVTVAAGGVVRTEVDAVSR